MPKGVPKSGKRKVNKVAMVDCTIKLPLEVKQGLTTAEKRESLRKAFAEKVKNNNP